MLTRHCARMFSPVMHYCNQNLLYVCASIISSSLAESHEPTVGVLCDPERQFSLVGGRLLHDKRLVHDPVDAEALFTASVHNDRKRLHFHRLSDPRYVYIYIFTPPLTRS
jgi:hypothetical protein